MPTAKNQLTLGGDEFRKSRIEKRRARLERLIHELNHSASDVVDDAIEALHGRAEPSGVKPHPKKRAKVMALR